MYMIDGTIRLNPQKIISFTVASKWYMKVNNYIILGISWTPTHSIVDVMNIHYGACSGFRSMYKYKQKQSI